MLKRAASVLATDPKSDGNWTPCVVQPLPPRSQQNRDYLVMRSMTHSHPHTFQKALDPAQVVREASERQRAFRRRRTLEPRKRSVTVPNAWNQVFSEKQSDWGTDGQDHYTDRTWSLGVNPGQTGYHLVDAGLRQTSPTVCWTAAFGCVSMHGAK